MDNKMKVINLILGKYHNKEMPKHIIINRLNYFYNEDRKTYESEYGEQMSFDFTDNVLNMEVEVVEEQEEIDIQSLHELVFNNDNANLKNQSNLLINKLVQAVKYLDNKLKEK